MKKFLNTVFFRSLRLNIGHLGTNLFSLLIFKLTWIFLVLFNNSGIIASLFLIFFAVALLPYSFKQIKFAITVAAIGVSIDGILTLTGIFHFNAYFLPSWLVLLWMSFALTLPFGLYFLASLPLYQQALIGAITGCISYFAGMYAGSVNFNYSQTLTAAVLALIWFFLTPMLLQFIKRSNSEIIIRR